MPRTCYTSRALLIHVCGRVGLVFLQQRPRPRLTSASMSSSSSNPLFLPPRSPLSPRVSPLRYLSEALCGMYSEQRVLLQGMVADTVADTVVDTADLAGGGSPLLSAIPSLFKGGPLQEHVLPCLPCWSCCVVYSVQSVARVLYLAFDETSTVYCIQYLNVNNSTKCLNFERCIGHRPIESTLTCTVLSCSRCTQHRNMLVLMQGMQPRCENINLCL